MIRILFLTILIGIGLGLVAWLVLAAQFAVSIATREGALIAAPKSAVRDDLPDAVKAFADKGLTGGETVATVRFTQDADMQRSPGQDWLPLTARQVVSASAPGFLWVARQGGFGPVPMVRVLDAYDPQRGGVLAIRLLGAFPIGTLSGGPADRAEAMRYLAELPWCPDAILTNHDIGWEKTAAGYAATLGTKGGEARVEFTFDSDGDIVAVSAEERPATMPDGTTALLPWRGTMGDYDQMGERRVPRRVEVGYVHDTGYAPYFRAEITQYEVLR